MRILIALFLSAATGLLMASSGSPGGVRFRADSPYGIGTHLARARELPDGGKLLDAARSMGADWIRVGFDWYSIERKAGVFDYAVCDRAVELAAEKKFRVCALLTNPPRRVLPIAKHRAEWMNFVRKTVSRYGDRIRCWEIWNEHNSATFWGGKPDPAEYTALLKETAKEIRKLVPGAVIVFGGTAGVPLPYIEKCFQAGAGEAFDVMNIHPYIWPWEPEGVMEHLDALRKLMTKYKLGGKPVWATEIGWSTMRVPNFYKDMLPAMFEKLGMDTHKLTLGVIDDPGAGLNWFRDSDFGPTFAVFRKVEKIPFAKLCKLPVERYPVLIPSLRQEFPCRYIPELIDYVRRGGTLLILQGAPFYYDLQPDFVRGPRRLQINDKHMASFHIGWDAFWTSKVPGRIEWQRPAKEFDGKIKLDPRTFARFLHTRNMKKGDEFIPVVEAGDKKYSGVIAGIYRLRSDLRGNVVWCLGCGPSWVFEYIGEERQAEFIPRAILLGRLHGMAKVFPYSFRSDEWFKNGDHREAHFGMVRENLVPKPAYSAYQTLTRMCPPGSTPPQRGKDAFINAVSWRRPDGKKVWALWTRFRPRDCRISTIGSIESAIDLLGGKIAVPSGIVTVTPRIQYLVGPEKLNLILLKR